MHDRSAFSLVELSIVLVILGLLVGGVLSGRSLIRAAELRNITVEYQNWKTAINAFEIEYNALPGDMKEATRFWGPAADCTPMQYAPISTNGSTCNGNGDGMLSTSLEPFTFWQHLSNARLIEGVYNGNYNDYGEVVEVPGEGSPSSKSGGNNMWQTRYITSGTRFFTDTANRNVFILVGGVTQTNAFPSLSTEETWGIDSKIDDGKPATGMVFSRTGTTCTQKAAGAAGNTVSADVNAEYRTALAGKTCQVYFAF